MALSLNTAKLIGLNHSFSQIKSNTSPVTASNAALGELRNAVLDDMDQVVPIVPAGYFPVYLLPPLRGGDDLVPRTLKRLENQGLIVDNRWTFWDDEPCNLDENTKRRLVEDNVFAAFADLAKHVADAALVVDDRLGLAEPGVVFECNSTCTPLSKNRKEPSKSKPDAYALLLTHANPITWCDVAIPAEFKEKDATDDRLDNYEKILWSMCYIMQEDARRRFVFGFTIENVSMRLWFLSRSEVLVSEAFNFMTEREVLVDFILRTTFAKRSEIGFDETITRLSGLSPVDQSVRYDIQVRDPKKTPQEPLVKTYRTRRLISEVGALSPRGRGTRVWEVYELDGNGEELRKLDDKGNLVLADTLVVKETWSDVDRLSEGEIIDKIRSKAEAAGKLYDFETHFMDTSRFGDVYIDDGPDSRPDTTAGFRQSRLSAPEIALDVETLLVSAKPRPNQCCQVVTVQGPVNKERIMLPTFSRYPHKVHHRIAFTEVGQPVFQAKSLRKAYRCVGDVIKGLDLMHSLGWIHRDISYGNILLVGKRGKITDLEYAKEETDTSVHGIRTGTMYFMSEEVYKGGYLHLPPAKDRPKLALEDIDYHADDDDDDDDDADAWDNEPDADSDTDNDADGDGDDANDEDEADEADAVADDNAYADICDATGEVDAQDADDNTAEVPNTNVPLYGPSPNASITDVPFRHNPLHDFESVVWLSFYLLLAPVFKSRKTAPEVASKYRTKQEVVFHKLFSDRITRTHIMSGESQVDHHFSELDPTVSAVAQQLLEVRTPLVNAFRRAEAEMTAERPIPFSVGEEAAAGMGTELLKIIAETLASKDLSISTEDTVTRPRRPVAKQAATEDGAHKLAASWHRGLILLK
ncbi:hypothetical protein PsYK624_112530 [Phanerochaete sordida]|uniref:Fungal-type protein kinase domain-containing protein n=1 Tax=Phanerochaete sordida TaxID=48140 RepID=A0A9P3GKC3_9APHY|nr:hypothetical protein PsYK624_112530 [Phanerochaete sordida]